MYRSSPLSSALNMCASANECHHPHPTPPHPIPCDVCAGDSGVEKMMQNCACVYLWLQSVCAGDSGKWLCAHVTPVCVRGWLWVEKMMQNCACVYLWLQSVSECVCAGDPPTYIIFWIFGMRIKSRVDPPIRVRARRAVKRRREKKDAELICRSCSVGLKLAFF